MRQILAFLVILSFSALVKAQELTPLEVYSKCYSRLSNHPVDIDSSVYSEVKAGTKDPIVACEELLGRLSLTTDAGQRKLTDPSDQIAISILENFQQFHESWFSGFGSRVGGNARFFNLTNDYSEPALFITEALAGDRHYRSILTRSDSVRGVRQGRSSTSEVVGGTNLVGRVAVIGPAIGGPGGVGNTDPANFVEFRGNPITFGELIGFETTPSTMLPQRRNLYSATINDSNINTLVEDDSQVDMARHFGGGILGSSSHLNFNAEAGNRLNGGNRIHRRWANSLFSDIMCLTLPTLRQEDVTAFVNRYTASELPFRTDRSCAQCHATMDPFADAARNLVIVSTIQSNQFIRNLSAAYPDRSFLQMEYVKPYKVRTNTQVNVDDDQIYSRRRPNAHLYYRDYEGRLVSQNVIGLQAMGEAMAQQEDPYVCAAQRYYAFLTGVQIPVANPASSDASYLQYRSEIIELGKSLKDHGSLRRLIVDILKTNNFKKRNPGIEFQQEDEQ